MESASLNVDILKFLPPDHREKEYDDGDVWYDDYCSSTLMKMLEEGLHADIRLKARGGSVKAHRCVLASCSPVFDAMFKQEQLTSTVEISDMTIEGLQFFLILLYFPNDSAEAWTMHEFAAALDKHFDEFIQACHKYQVSKLGSFVADALRRNLTPENCWDYYHNINSSTDFQISAPPYICYEYIMNNYCKIIASDNFLLEMQRNPERLQSFMTTYTASIRPGRNG